MIKNKKNYLNQYLIQESKITRLKQMKRTSEAFKNRYDNEIKRSVSLRKEIEEKIDKVDNDVLREILYNKYILGKTLEEISFVVNYSKRHVERLHIKALEEIIV